jgi:pSer/pThr/pTyr-binding forkhead associated (FHA) protein
MLNVKAVGDEDLGEYPPGFVVARPQGGFEISDVVDFAVDEDEMQTIERAIEPKIRPTHPTPSQPYYFQITFLGTKAHLETNLPHTDRTNSTPAGLAWLIGRSRNCAIVIPDPSVSRCHAVVGYDYHQGLYVMDMGSSNGTFLNQQRLTSLKRYPLTDGQILRFSQLTVQVFLNH